MRSKLLVWSPRILGIAVALFLSIFALDVFDGQAGIVATLVGLLIHLIPTFLILLVVFVAWRREWLGAVAFVALAVGYLVMAWGRFPAVVYLVISGPLAVTGGLFLLSWIARRHAQVI